VDDEEEAPPTPRWYDVAAGNETQVKAWLGYANEVLDHYKVQGMPMMTLLSVVAQKIPGLRPENYSMVMAQVEKTLRESPAFELRKGKSGGIFRKTTAAEQSEYDKTHNIFGRPLTHKVTNEVINDHTCGCGNTKCNKTEKSCWRCGAPIT
jgi:hypothetical protein